MSIDQLYERLAAAASLEGADGALRISATYEPASGPGSKVSPPTYPASGTEGPYAVEDRIGADGTRRRCALLDSRQSQANRCEEALQQAIGDGRIALPHLVLDVETHGTRVAITSLTAPHRSRDAYFRDAVTADGSRFDATPAGASLLSDDAAAFYRHTPADLVYGVWDSHRQRRIQTKFPRIYTSEVIGEEAVEGVRMAGRYDLLTGDTPIKKGGLEWEIAEKAGEKGSRKLSEIGLGPIPPQKRPGGVTVATIRREGSVSFAGLARLRVAEGGAGRAGRAVLAALALVGDRLAFGRPSVFLRSGCDLVLIDEKLAWVGRGGQEDLELSPDDAIALFRHAVERAAADDLVWQTEPIRLVPMPKLQAVIDKVFLTAPAEGE